MAKKKSEKEEVPVEETEKSEPSARPVKKERVRLDDFANRHITVTSGSQFYLMAGFVHQEKVAGRLMDSEEEYRKRFEEFKRS